MTMTKKVYIKPVIDVLDSGTSGVLAGSLRGDYVKPSNAGIGENLSRKNDFFDDEEYYDDEDEGMGYGFY